MLRPGAQIAFGNLEGTLTTSTASKCGVPGRPGCFAGYGKFRHPGDLAASVVLRVTLSPADRFEGARVYPVRLTAEGRPVPGGGATAVVARLAGHSGGPRPGSRCVTRADMGWAHIPALPAPVRVRKCSFPGPLGVGCPWSGRDPVCSFSRGRPGQGAPGAGYGFGGPGWWPFCAGDRPRRPGAGPGAASLTWVRGARVLRGCGRSV